MMQQSKTFLPIFLFLLIMCTASSTCCTQSSSELDMLQVIPYPANNGPTIIDAQKVQQLFAEEHRLPLYQYPRVWVDEDFVCVTYTLKFWAGINLVEQDEMAAGPCSRITFPNGSEHLVTLAFQSHLETLLHTVSDLDPFW